MSRYVACNAKYYKKSKMGGLKDHIEREFDNDQNVFPELSKDNFSCHLASFDELEKRMLQAKKNAGRKIRGFQDNANVMLDNVLILSREVVDGLKKERPDDYKNILGIAAKDLAKKIQDKFGLEPMSINFHFDEGHLDKKTGEFKNNYHAHMSFFNFCFNKLTQPLRTMNRADFSKIQDLAAEAFQSLGFERGEKKKTKNRDHLEKSEFIKRVNEDLKDQNNSLVSNNDLLNAENLELKNESDLLKGKYDLLAKDFKKLSAKFFKVGSMAKRLRARQDDFKEYLNTDSGVIAENEVRRLSELLNANNIEHSILDKDVTHFINEYFSLKV